MPGKITLYDLNNSYHESKSAPGLRCYDDLTKVLKEAFEIKEKSEFQVEYFKGPRKCKEGVKLSDKENTNDCGIGIILFVRKELLNELLKDIYNLNARDKIRIIVYNELNVRYFGGELPKPTLLEDAKMAMKDQQENKRREKIEKERLNKDKREKLKLVKRTTKVTKVKVVKKVKSTEGVIRCQTRSRA